MADTTQPTFEQLAPDPESPEGKKLLRKAIAASAIGNATEWYDYGVYGAAASFVTHAFFPGHLGSIGTMLGFAVSFALRPLGGMIWGPIGDRLGRKAVLAMTILLISGATALIGVLPTHAVVGIWAPVLLIALRVVQGFSTGGEYGGAATFMAEYAPDKKRGRFGCFLEFGTLAGLSAGTAMVLIINLALPDDAMQTWGWRIPFLLALPLGLVGLYLRSQMDDTPVFKEMEQKDEIEGTAWSRFVDLLANLGASSVPVTTRVTGPGGPAAPGPALGPALGRLAPEARLEASIWFPLCSPPRSLENTVLGSFCSGMFPQAVSLAQAASGCDRQPGPPQP